MKSYHCLGATRIAVDTHAGEIIADTALAWLELSLQAT